MRLRPETVRLSNCCEAEATNYEAEASLYAMHKMKNK